MASNKIDAVKRRIALACRIMYKEGMVEHLGYEFAGHISVKIAPNRFVMPGHLHDKARGLYDIRPSDMVVADMNGKVVSGRLEPVDEIVIHTGIYKARPEVNSVLHMHAPAATALASSDQTILPVSIRGSFFWQGVPVLERGPCLIDSEEIANELVAKMGNLPAVIHKGHGIVTAGKNLDEACISAILLEGAARQQILSKQFGNLVPFERDAVTQFGKTGGISDHSKAWEYFENKWSQLKP
jgi:ribulose-5-phosphate 4-epimerase/fuculose-1-phosphate aldolase